MARGPKKHMKRIAAPSHWMLDKLTGHYAPRPSTGPHKLRECLPLVILLRNRLKYALTYNEVRLIVMQRLIRVDGKVRTDCCFPTGFMDVINIDKTKQSFRILLDTKGRFIPQPISLDESKFKLCKVRKLVMGGKSIPSIVTHDGRTIRYPHPTIKINDSIVFDIENNKIIDTLKFEVGKMAMVTCGHNVGRVGFITNRDRHLGGFDIIHLRDSKNHEFATRIGNVFVIGNNVKCFVSLPKDKGIKMSDIEDRQKRLKKQA